MQFDINKLIGLKVIIEISEPWEVSVALDQVTIKAVIEKIRNSNILLKLHASIKIKEKLCNYFVATKRYEGEPIQDMLHKNRLIVSIIPIPVETAETTDPFEYSTMYRGLGLIGTLLFPDG